MERRTGIVLDDTFPPGTIPTPELCQRISTSVVDTLVKIHAIDWSAAGLGDFGHPTGFLGRQVKGWTERYIRAQTDKIPQVEPLMHWLVEHTPASAAPTLIHNDFKLNNILMNAQDLAQPVAVLDWEMATIGDPLFDLAITLSYWVQSDDPKELQSLTPTVTTWPGFINRTQFMERYSAQSGRDLSSMHFYMTFAYFKMAVILQQIYVRWKRGQTQDNRFSLFDSHIRTLINHAAQLAENGKI
jgi:aminoglycoside phosphotransferase (APT) family kinase protein